MTTPAAPPAPPAAPPVSRSNNGDGSATVTWVDGSTNETGFEVRARSWDANAGVWKQRDRLSATVPGPVTLVDVSGAGTYRYIVRAVNAGGASG